MSHDFNWNNWNNWNRNTFFFLPCYLSFKKICLPLQASTANSRKRLPTEAGLVSARVIP